MSSLFKVVSTFSGCGGSSLGYQMAGGEILLAVELDDNAVETYRLNFPNTPIYHGDIANLSVEEVLCRTGLKPGELDILDGSPPCQGFSTAGKRKFEDNRNQLFREFVRLLCGLQPKVFIMENVSGMVKGKMKLIFAEILQGLKASGYKVSCRVLNAMYYGVPQSRSRTIFIGVRNDLGIQPTHPEPRTRPISVKESFEGLPLDNSRTLHDEGYGYFQKVRPGDDFGSCHPKGHWFNAKKCHPMRPSLTITKMVRPGGGGGIYHWAFPRVLNIPELKRVASYPDNFKFHGVFKDQWARIGNSVPPLFMKAIAEHVRDTILTHA